MTVTRQEAQSKKALKEKKRALAEDKRKRPPLPPPTPEGFAAIAIRSRDVDRSPESKLRELKALWHNAKEAGCLTDALKVTLTDCAAYAKRQGAQSA